MPQAIPLALAAIAQASAAAVASAQAAIASTFTLATLAKVGASIGLSVLASALLTRQDGPKPQNGQINIRQPIPVAKVGVGRCRIGGAYVLYHQANGESYDVLALHFGRIDGFEQFYLNDDLVTVGPDGLVSHPERYGDAVRLWTRVGLTSETAYSEVVDGIGDPDVWSSDHTGDGIASLGLFCHGVDVERIRKTYPNVLPSPNAVARLTRLYDPRSEATAWSANAALAILWYLHYEHGLALDYDDIDLDSFKVAANVCDELVALKAGGTEPRYECHGTFDLDPAKAPPVSVLAAMLSTCDGRLFQRADGRVALLAGKYVAPTVRIGRSHIRQFSPRFDRSIERRTSVVQAKFTSPAHAYSEQDADPWVLPDVLAEIGERTAGLDLTWVHSHGQARRLQKRQAIRLESWAEGTMVTDLVGLDAIDQQWIIIDVPDYAGFSELVVEVVSHETDPTGLGAIIEWRAYDVATLDAWNAAAEEGTAPAVPEQGASGAVAAPQNLVVDVRGEANRPYLRLRFDEYGRDDLTVEVKTRFRDPDGSWSGWESRRYQKGDLDTAGGRTRIETGIVQPDTRYQVKATAISPGGYYSDESAVFEVWTFAGTPDAPTDIDADNTGGGHATVTVTMPAEPDKMFLRIWRGASGDSFADASDVSGQILVDADEVYEHGDIPGAGSWKYWATVEVAANRRSANTSAASVSVT
jgi:hypothetical protein